MSKAIALVTVALALVDVPGEPLSLRLFLVWFGIALLVLLPETIFEESRAIRLKRLKTILPSSLMSVAVAALVHFRYDSELVSFGICVLTAIFGERFVAHLATVDKQHRLTERIIMMFVSGVLFKVLRIKITTDTESTTTETEPQPTLPPTEQELDDTYFLKQDDPNSK